MESELKKLRLLTRRLTCKDLEGLSFTELLLLESRLRTVLLIVKDKKKEIELQENERLLKQKKEAEDEDDGMRREVFVTCISSTSSSGERLVDRGPPLSQMQIEFERRHTESMQMEYERLWLLKERMNGRELDGMNSAELALLEDQIKYGLVDLQEHRFAPTMEEMARKRREKLIPQHERCSLDDDKDDDHPVQSPNVSRKLRRPRRQSNRYGCSSEEKLQEQDDEAALRKEVMRLRLLIKRMGGKDDGVTFSELLALESHLMGVRRIVLDQKKKIKLEEDERLLKQKKEAEDEADGTRGGVLVPCKLSTSSSGETREIPNGDALVIKREFERRSAETLQSEFQRLWLFNERMNGRELEGMTSFDLALLHIQILRALQAVIDQKLGPRREQTARQCEKESISRIAERERCSLDNDKDDDTSLQFRLLLVSRKLRRFHSCYHRKSMPDIRSVCQSQTTSD